MPADKNRAPQINATTSASRIIQMMVFFLDKALRFFSMSLISSEKASSSLLISRFFPKYLFAVFISSTNSTFFWANDFENNFSRPKTTKSEMKRMNQIQNKPASVSIANMKQTIAHIGQSITCASLKLFPNVGIGIFLM